MYHLAGARELYRARSREDPHGYKYVTVTRCGKLLSMLDQVRTTRMFSRPGPYLEAGKGCWSVSGHTVIETVSKGGPW